MKFYGVLPSHMSVKRAKWGFHLKESRQVASEMKEKQCNYMEDSDDFTMILQEFT